MMNINNFVKRLISALIMIPIAILLVYQGGMLFESLIVIAAILMAFEWQYITHHQGQPKNIWNIIGIALIAAPCLSLIWLRRQSHGFEIVMWLFLVVWGSDIGGYIFGKTFKGPKLAAKISPNKTWSGFAGGVLLAGIFGSFFINLYNYNIVNFITFAIIISIYSQISDLLESYVKRRFGVKDSGNIIPGHGGILDRVDGLILAAPKTALLLYLTGGNLF